MYSMKKEKYLKRSPGKNIAFYISLTLCIAAVAGAAWNTYGTVEEYAEEDIVEQSSPGETSSVEAANEVSGVKYPDAEKSSDASQAESSAESSVQTSEKQESQETSRTFKPITKGDIIKPYSTENPVFSQTMKDWRTHSGIDISGVEGSPVHAVEAGVVSEIRQDPLLGNVIVVKSSKYELYYCGLTNVSLVEQGSHVAAGETIGYIGSIPSESEDEPHLHLEAKTGGKYTDPSDLF